MKDMMVFCTLFNSGYLDKGLALLRSLHETADMFRIYVVAFDDECYRILTQLFDDNLKVISLQEFETQELLQAKMNRTAQEYCWTCSCHVIKYVLETYKEKQCTYIDADMYFYHNPQVLFDEIEHSDCDVSIIEHGFILNKENTRYITTSGKYCVEFNTFYATENGMKILRWWCDRCIECCTAKADGMHFGDQKYLDDWLERFEGVHVIQNPGAGIAPWNLAKYTFSAMEGNDIMLKEKATGKIFPVIFYHYQQIKYYSDKEVDIGVYMYPHNVSLILRNVIYEDYFKNIRQCRKALKDEMGFDIISKAIYTEKFSYIQLLLETIKFERNPFIILRRLWRILIRKRKDIMEV